MGYLEQQDEFYDFNECRKFQQKIKEKGIVQFLFLLKKYQSYQLSDHNYNHYDCKSKISMKNEDQNPPYNRIYFADQFEGYVVKLDLDEKKVLLNSDTSDIYLRLKKVEKDLIIQKESLTWINQKTYCYMSFNADDIINNVRERVKKFQSILPQNQFYLLLPMLPRLGCQDFDTYVNERHQSGKTRERNESVDSQSQVQTTCEDVDSDDSSPREIDIQHHVQYESLNQNIEIRRGSKIDIRIPVFRDYKTTLKATKDEPYSGYIHMDKLNFGDGNCFLQLSFLALNMDHARHLHDQLVPLAPLISALTAGTSIYKGKLADWDTKWDYMSMGLDDRVSDEKDPNTLRYLPKPRYCNTQAYLSNGPMYKKEYDDFKLKRNDFIMNYAKEKSKEFNIELDEKLLLHLGSMFVRDALVVQKNKIDVDDSKNTNHFNNFQNSNWNSVVFKPPSSQDSDMGWRVEFKTAEIQINPDENSAMNILMMRIAQMFYYKDFNLNFYIPMSYVEENFRRSRLNNAIMKEKFFFRKNVFDVGPPDIIQMSLYEIFFGKPEADFIGIMNLIDLVEQRYNKVDQSKFPQERLKANKLILQKIHDYIRQKTTGTKKTLAQWQRDFVIKHPHYDKDSIVTEQIQFDLIKKILTIQHDRQRDGNFNLDFSDVN